MPQDAKRPLVKEECFGKNVGKFFQTKYFKFYTYWKSSLIELGIVTSGIGLI